MSTGTMFAMRSTLLVAVSCLLVFSASAAVTGRKSSASHDGPAAAAAAAAPAATPRGILQGPSNVAMLFGASLTLPCRVEVTGNERIQWWEYSTNANGAQISDMNVLLPGHPNQPRYAVLYDGQAGIYDLYIYPTVLADGGYYKCLDVNAVPPATQNAGAEVVMIDKNPNCTTTLPPNGVVIEDQYHTTECIMHFKASAGVDPLMTWTGPEPFTGALTRTNASVWSGIGYTVTRGMEASMFKCLTNFTEQGFGGADSATNVPSWQYEYRTQQIFVNWPPKSMYSDPVHVLYEIGQTITCHADAFPPPSYKWQNMMTLEIWRTQSFTIREDMVGNQTMRCNAQNLISSIIYTNDHFIPNFLVKPKPTTPTPGVSTTTTEIPAEAYCDELSGRWEAADPKAMMCVWLDLESNGVLMGLFKNGTETFYADIYGRAQVNSFDQGGFSAVWPSTMGVSGHVFECKKCYGTEIMKVSQIIRSDTSAAECGDVGVTHRLPEFTFNRVANSPPCTSDPPSFF